MELSTDKKLLELRKIQRKNLLNTIETNQNDLSVTSNTNARNLLKEEIEHGLKDLEEIDADINTLEAKIKAIEDSQSNLEGKNASLASTSKIGKSTKKWWRKLFSSGTATFITLIVGIVGVIFTFMQLLPMVTRCSISTVICEPTVLTANAETQVAMITAPDLTQTLQAKIREIIAATETTAATLATATPTFTPTEDATLTEIALIASVAHMIETQQAQALVGLPTNTSETIYTATLISPQTPILIPTNTPNLTLTADVETQVAFAAKFILVQQGIIEYHPVDLFPLPLYLPLGGMFILIPILISWKRTKGNIRSAGCIIILLFIVIYMVFSYFSIKSYFSTMFN